MKIDNSTKNLNGIPITDTQTSPNKVTGKSESVPETDSVQISSASLQSNEVFDSSKVDAIKEAISSGQFTVDTGKVADGLINTVKDLLKPN